MPSEESHAKALSLVDQAVKLDNENDLDTGMKIQINFFIHNPHQLIGIYKN